MKLDDRQIQSIWFPSGESGWIVDNKKVTCIEVEYAAGEMAMVPWFAVHGPKGLVCRCNAQHIEAVMYKPEE